MPFAALCLLVAGRANSARWIRRRRKDPTALSSNRAAWRRRYSPFLFRRNCRTPQTCRPADSISTASVDLRPEKCPIA